VLRQMGKGPGPGACLLMLLKGSAAVLLARPCPAAHCQRQSDWWGWSAAGLWRPWPGHNSADLAGVQGRQRPWPPAWHLLSAWCRPWVLACFGLFLATLDGQPDRLALETWCALCRRCDAGQLHGTAGTGLRRPYLGPGRCSPPCWWLWRHRATRAP